MKNFVTCIASTVVGGFAVLFFEKKFKVSENMVKKYDELKEALKSKSKSCEKKGKCDCEETCDTKPAEEKAAEQNK